MDDNFEDLPSDDEEFFDQEGDHERDEDVDEDEDEDDYEDDDEDEKEGTLANLSEATSLRWIFVGGKGGVGKTTTSCSIGVRLAEERPHMRHLIISTDPAHNLSDAFAQKFGKDPVAVKGFDNLWCMEIDPVLPETALFGNEGALAEAQASGSLPDGFSAEGLGGIQSLMKDLTAAVPGIDEAMSFAELMKQVQKMDYDTVVFDTAPTGHTLRLLSFPTTMEKAIGKILDLKNKFSGMFGNIARMFGSDMGSLMGAQGGKMLEKLEEMRDIINRVNNLFKDSDSTTFVCVSIPEFLSLYETERLVQELAKFEIDTHNVVVNQVLKPVEWDYNEIKNPSWADKTCKNRIKMQQKYINQFNILYADFHICTMPLLNAEVRGVPLLRKFGKLLFTGEE